MSTVSVVPSDKLIIVDGEAIVFDAPFVAPENMHALQWNGTSGHIEWEDDYNWILGPEAYEEEVAPYVAIWQAEQARREQAAAEAEAALFEKEPVKVETVTRETPATVTRETPATVTRETPETATTETTETSKPVTEMVEELSTSSSEMEVIESSESEATSSEEEEEDVLDLTKEVTSDTDTDMTVDSSL